MSTSTSTSKSKSKLGAIDKCELCHNDIPRDTLYADLVLCMNHKRIGSDPLMIRMCLDCVEKSHRDVEEEIAMYLRFLKILSHLDK